MSAGGWNSIFKGWKGLSLFHICCITIATLLFGSYTSWRNPILYALLLRRLVLSRRLAQWLLQLSEFEIIPITPTIVKGKVIADLLAWFPGEESWDVTNGVPEDLLKCQSLKQPKPGGFLGLMGPPLLLNENSPNQRNRGSSSYVLQTWLPLYQQHGWVWSIPHKFGASTWNGNLTP